MSARGYLCCDNGELSSIAHSRSEDTVAAIPSGVDRPRDFGHVTAFQIQSHPSAAIWQFLQMVTLRLLCFSAVPLFSAPLPIQAQTSSATDTAPSCAAELKAGVVVESVARNSEGEKAGLAEEDVILGWSRGDVKGQIESPFSLSEIEVEQEPQGQVTLEGTRGGLKQAWTLGPDKWGIEARPSLPSTVFDIYRKGQELAKAGKLSDAAERWRAAAAEGQKYKCSWLSSWFLFHAAEMLANEQQWKESDALYQEAIRQATGASPRVRAQILQALAEAFAQQSDSANAEKYQQEALKEIQRSGIEGLAAVVSLTGLGNIAKDRGDLNKAEDYYHQGLAISEKLAPGSLAVAAGLNNLGLVADHRGDLAKAEEYHRQALEIRKRLAPGSLAVAASLNSLGNVAHDRGDLDKSEDYYRRGLEIKVELAPGSLTVAATLLNLGNVAEDRGDLAKAEDYYRQALEIRKRLAPGSLAVAASLNSLGNVAHDRGDLAKAQEYFHQALAVNEKLAPGSLAVATSLNNLGNVADDRGDLAKAEDYYRQTLEIGRKLAPGSLDVATSLNNLGLVANERGDLAKTEDYYRQALEIRKKLAPHSLDVAASLNNLGNVEDDRGDLAKAEDYYRQALEIEKKLAPGSLQVATALYNLGEDRRHRSDLAQAQECFHQALAIFEKLASDSLQVAMVIASLGELARDRGDLAQAEEFFQQSLTINEKLAPGSLDVARGLNNLSEVAHDRGDLAKGEAYCRQALEIRKKLAPESADYAESLATLAGVMRDEQLTEEAVRLFAQAIDVFESQIAHLGGSSDIRADFRAKHADYYSAYSDLLLTQKQPELAFQVLERSRARTLLETLTEAHVNIRQGADPSLLERERTLQVTLTAKSNRKIKLLEGEHTDEQVAAFSKEIDDLLSQYQMIEGQIRTGTPNYAALTQPQPLSAKEIQQQLLDADTILLEYALGEKHSLVFVLTPTSLHSYELPKRSEIEHTAHHVYDLLTMRNRWIKGESSLQRKERVNKSEAEYQKTAATLSQMVLGPLAARLEEKRLLIVADGALQYLPFAVLPIPTADASKPAVPLVAEHEIVNLPSASVLALLRRQANGRRAAPNEVAVLADPVFDRQDSRVGKAANDRQVTESASANDLVPSFAEGLTRSLRDVGLGTRQAGAALPRLAFSRREADAIMAMTDSGKGMEALDFQASRETAQKKELGQYRIVHFATHGLLDNEHPELSGLVLSLVDQEGKSQDGFLDLEDVYNLTLPVDLVVLSACETGLGKQITGEGLVGLTRGFMYAGASRVVASLWKVDDVATADLMERFYRGMLKEGMRPAAALRHAQMEMQHQKRWADPYYWAAFTLQGEWK